MRQPVRDYFVHAFFLSLAVFLTWFWVNNPILVNYNLELTAFLIVVYFVFRLFGANSPAKNLLVDGILFTIILLLALATTGGLESSFFFLIYFLLFAFALLFDPPTTLTLTLALTLFFAKTLDSTHGAIQLFSLLLFSPLALFFGSKYLKLLAAKEKIKILSEKTKELGKEKKELSQSICEEETDSLLWLSLNLRSGLLQICHESAELLSGLGRLTIIQKEKLEKIHDSAKELLKSGEKLEKKIDRETD